MAKKKRKSPTDALTVYQSLVEKTPGLELKGAKSRYTSLNGNMFSFLTSEGEMALRLSKDDREDFLDKYENAVCIQYGTVMREYVLVPRSLLGDTRQIAKLFKMSHSYASSLKPKATKRKATTAKKVARKAVKKKKK